MRQQERVGIAPSISQISNHDSPNRWLSIDEAARLLGVGPSTLRRWSDAGLIPVFRTAGGHRRFREADVVAAMKSESRPRRRLSRKVLTDLSNTFYHNQLLQQVAGRPWYQRYRSEHLAELRTLGRQLLDIAFRIVNRAADRQVLTQVGQQIGRRYGEISREAGLNPAETVEAFLAFRAPAYMAIAHFAEREDISSRRLVRVLSGLTIVLDHVLLATMQALTE